MLGLQRVGFHVLFQWCGFFGKPCREESCRPRVAMKDERYQKILKPFLKMETLDQKKFQVEDHLEPTVGEIIKNIPQDES